MFGDGVMPGRQAGSGFWQVLYIQCQEPKTWQQKVQLYHEDDPLLSSSYTIYLWLMTSVAKPALPGACFAGARAEALTFLLNKRLLLKQSSPICLIINTLISSIFFNVCIPLKGRVSRDFYTTFFSR